MKLLANEVGWSATSSQLFWTTSAGALWKDITPLTIPKRTIASVFFLNESTGWVLFVSKAPEMDEPRFEIASTADAGTTWSIVTVKIPNLNSETTTLSGDARIVFADPLHGWMNLGVTSSANFRLGGLLATSDGGKSWDWTADSPGISGAVRLVNINDGWIAGGPGNHQLFVTHDGGKSWKELSMKAPASAYPANNPIYDVPTFQDNKNGLLPVTFSGAEGSGLAVVAFTTEDGGATWNSDIVVSNLPEIYGGIPFPSTVVDSTLITAMISSPGKLTLRVFDSSGKKRSAKTGAIPVISVVSALSFATINVGWILANGKVFSTVDGGANWKDITASASKGEVLPAVARPNLSRQDTSLYPEAPNSVGLETVGHTGFHMCDARELVPCRHGGIKALFLTLAST